MSNNMSNNNFGSIFNNESTLTKEQEASMSKSFVSNVFSYMFVALAITGIVAWWFGSSEQLFMETFMSVDANGVASPNMLYYVAMFSPFAFILVMNFGFNKISFPVLLILFLAFSVLMGLSLSSIFMVYTDGSIFSTFLVTSLTFGTMAFLGYTTQTDLTKMGNLLYMALFGLIFAMIINWFMQSPMMDYIISMIGVIVFTGLTAYDTQRMKRIGAGVEYGTAAASKLALMGAMSLYLNFINLFLFLLSFLGGRD